MIRTWDHNMSSTRSHQGTVTALALGHNGNRREPSARFSGFDYARCLLALAVVALHTQASGASRVAQAIYGHVLALAVPSFFLISLFLFAEKGQTSGRALARRVERLLLLFVFWSAAYAIAFRDSSPFVHAFNSVTNLVRLAVQGGNPVFYFFSCLALMTLAASVACRLPPPAVWALAVLSTSGLWLMTAMAGGRLSDEFAKYYNPLNFLPYAFIGPLLVSLVKRGSLRTPAAKATALAALFLVFAIITLLERQFLRMADGREPEPYSHPSTVLGAMLVVLAALMVRRPAPWLVRRLSEYSLGIYCVHVFLKPAISGFAQPPLWQCLALFALSIPVVAFLRRASRGK